ncbi:spermatogenesis-associated protein 8 isoform X2 [Gorilla gorilla gorilla]|uniref:Uncharacterized protein n=1 Tax=Gorilla gorilla gorilla TaxID=9595 RepID=G3REH6_GORGO|nr:spermatogenesis-associated protein 8 isoform X2 [Gorilla gorilla gorilla]
MAPAGMSGAQDNFCLYQEIAPSFQRLPCPRTSSRHFSEAMTCPCSWRPFKGGPGGLKGPVWPAKEENSCSHGRIQRVQRRRVPSASPLIQKINRRSVLFHPYCWS